MQNDVHTKTPVNEMYTLHQMRKQSGVSGAKAAELTGVSYQGLRNWETGAYIPNIVAVMDLLNIYGYTMDQLDLSPFYNEANKATTKKHTTEQDALALERLTEFRGKNTNTVPVLAE